MLSVFTRHYPPCLRKDVHYRRCHCPKWIQGTLEHKSYFRLSAKTRTWKRAEIRARAMELADLRPKPILLRFAIGAFLADQKARKLLPTTIKKSQFLLETTFGGWCVQEGLDSLDQIGPANLKRQRK